MTKSSALQRLTRQFDVEARAPGDAAPTPDQVGEMLRSLLPDRFHLSLHHEMRDLSYDALLIAKNGPKLIPASGDCKPHGKMGLVSLCNVGSEQLATALAAYARKRVVDLTDLNGKYDVEIHFDMAGGDLGAAVLAGAQEHLGVKLESRKSPFDVIVIDHFAAPGDN